MAFQQFLEKINPRTLFLIDSLGGLLSAVMLGLVLVQFEATFGMPKQVLYILASIACVFFICSMLGYLDKVKQWKRYMRIIAIANLLYCGLTLFLLIALSQDLTGLGFAYFIIEIMIIVGLAVVELKVAMN